jgi:hypothetical protein
MSDSLRKDNFDDQWSHVVAYANKAGGIIPGSKISFKSTSNSYIIKTHWKRWIRVCILFAFIIIHFLPILLPLIIPLDKGYPYENAVPLALFGFFWVYLAYRTSIPIGKITFNKESTDIHVTYGSLICPHNIIIPNGNVVLKTYMFKADKPDVKIKYGNTVLSVIHKEYPDSELILASVKDEKSINTIVNELNNYINKDTSKNISYEREEDIHSLFMELPKDNWQELAEKSQSKKPFLNYLVSSNDKLIVKDSSDHVLIKNRKHWILGIFISAFGAFFILMPIIVTIKEQEFNIFISLMSFGVSLIFFVPTYQILAYANKIFIKHRDNLILLKFGFYPFVKELSLTRHAVKVCLYKCDVEQANKVKKPGQVVLSLIRKEQNESELTLSTSDTKAQVIAAYEKLALFLGQSPQDELTEEIGLPSGEKVTVSTTSLSGNNIEKRKLRVISENVLAFKGSWLYSMVFGVTFIIGVILAICFIYGEPDERLSQKILSMILAIVVCGFMILGGIALFINSLFTRCVVANKKSDTLSFVPFVYHGLKGKKIATLSEIEAIQLCSVFTSVPSGNARRGASVYEINAITNNIDDKRINITSGQKHDQIRSEAAAFADFLGVPVLDHTVV